MLTVAAQDYEGRIDPDLAALVPASLAVVRSRALSHRWTRALAASASEISGLRARCLASIAPRGSCSMQRRFLTRGRSITIYPTYPAVLGPMLKRRFRTCRSCSTTRIPWVSAWGKDVGGGAAGAVDVKSRSTRALAERLEPRVLRAADGVTAVSARTYEDACARTGATPRAVAEIPIGWDAADLDALALRSARARLIPDDGRVNICYTGTLLPLGVATLRAVLAAARASIDRDPRLADRLRFYFFGTSNQSGGGEARVLPHARELGVAHLVHEHPARLDYLDALDALRQASALLLLGSSEPHYTPSKVFPALLANRPLLAVYHSEQQSA